MSEPEILSKLGPKIGPLPAGVWAVVIGGGLYLGHRRSVAAAAAGTAGATSPAAATDASSSAGPADATGAGAGTDSSYSLDATGLPMEVLQSGPPAAPAPAPVTVTVSLTSAPAPSRTGAPILGGLLTPAKKAPAPTKAAAPPRRATPRPPKAPARSVTVHPGDTLTAIAGRAHVSEPALYARNAGTIEAAAKAHGKPSSSGGHWIYPGTVLALP